MFACAVGLTVAAFICKPPVHQTWGADVAESQFAASNGGVSGFGAAAAGRLVPRWSGPAAGRDVDCLSKAVYYEARGESLAGQQAVAQVVLNRARHPGFPKSVCAVVFQTVSEGECQFSFVCDGAMGRPLEPVAWRRARWVAERALQGYVMTAVGKALNFHVAEGGRAPGAVATLGHHVFYVAQNASTYARPAVARVSVSHEPVRPDTIVAAADEHPTPEPAAQAEPVAE